MDNLPSRLTSALADRYRVERPLGEGGMATVYLAEDVRHGRKVALKVLKPELAAVIGAERFLAEIKTTASLQHPHILPLHDSGEADGFLFYVMPFIEGDTLRDRLQKEYQLPVEEALGIARDVADALDYAHRQGVIHRDIKPANILLHEGRPLVADFGIALAVSEAGAGRLTETGLSMGTPHYMSPEQASGERTIDARTDVYALGCVLYEMLAGQPPFPGGSAQAVLARILTTDPTPITTSRRTVPRHVEAVVTKALEKLPADRFESIKAFRDALDDESFLHQVRRSGAHPAVSGAGDVTGSSRAASPSGRRTWVPAAIVGAVALVLGWVLGTARDPGMERPPALRVPVDVGALGFPTFGRRIEVSPNGSALAVTAAIRGSEQSILVRTVGEEEFRPLPGTAEGANPSFSPDGQWVAFVDGDGSIRKVPLAGGSPTTVVPAGLDLDPFFVHWGDDGMLVFDGPEGLYEVSENGGEPRLLAAGPKLRFVPSHRLPEGRGVVGGSVDGSGIWLYEFGADTLRSLMSEVTDPRYAASGHLLYRQREGGLWAVPFDLESLELTGSPRPVLDGVRSYSVSRDGTLAYHVGGTAVTGNVRMFLMHLDEGRLDSLPVAPRNMYDGRFSPDGSKIAFGIGTGAGSNVFTYDLVLGGPTQLTFNRTRNWNPVWSPDGSHIAFASNDGNFADTDIYTKPLDGRTSAAVAVHSDRPETPSDWPADSLLLLTWGSAAADLAMYQVGRDTAPDPLLQAEWREMEPARSPDGSWIAYASDEGGDDAVYARRFPDMSGQKRISEGEGWAPRWSHDGRSLYYRTDEGIVEARLRFDPSFAVTSRDVVYRGPVRDYDAHPRERTLLLMTSAPSATDPPAGSSERWFIVANWFEELRQRLGEDNR